MARSGNSGIRLRPGRILKPDRERRQGFQGYQRVTLVRVDGKKIRRFVHQIVAEAFLGPCPAGQQVRHGPNGVDNNSADNLSYGTAAENAMDRERDGNTARGSRNGYAKLTEATVREIRRRRAQGEKLRALASEYGISEPAVSAVSTGRNWGHLT